MATKDVNTGTAGTLRVNLVETTDAVANTSDIAWEMWLLERVSSPTTHQSSPVDASVYFNKPAGGSGFVYSGTFTFDWAAAGLQSTLIASGTETVDHNADGTGTITVSGAIANTGTTGAGGVTVNAFTFELTTLTVVPGTPTSVVGSRVSDTSASVSWAQTSASNGAPVANTVRRKINGGAWADAVTIAPATSTSLSAAANQKLEYAVKGTNAAGDSAWSSTSSAIYTSPAAPTGVSADKDASLDIIVSWTSNVGFSEHAHKVEAASSSDGGSTWSSWSTLTTTGSGGTYTHSSPDSAKQWKYRVTAVNTDAGALASTAVASNVVQLLAAPNKPTLPALGPFVDKAKDFIVPWTHNTVDTTPQTAYELGYSTNGGSSWSTTGKVTSTTPSKTFSASTYAADVELTVRVRTWGEATTGGPNGNGSSAWSDLSTVTFKTRPVATIAAPADSGTYTQAKLFVELGFSQTESATFVSATIQLFKDATLVETLLSTTRSSTLMTTRVTDGDSYTVKVIVTDSNGVVSDEVTSAFDVAYTLPVAAVVTATYLSDSGIGQLDLTIADPGGGEAAVTLVTITRTIAGVTETVVEDYPKAASLTILDMTPTINGTNDYTVTTTSGDGATIETPVSMVTTEGEWGFLSIGAGFAQIVKFGGNFALAAAPSVDSALVKAAGRSRPIGLYSNTGDLVVTGQCVVLEGFGSTVDELEEFLSIPGKACYRDPSGRRMFGHATGGVSRSNSAVGAFSYTITETS